MIICPSCGAKNSQFDSGCFQCGFKPTLVEGITAWAPDLAKQNDGFPKDSFSILAQVEAKNFWFRTRNDIIIWALQKYFPQFQSFLEVGCGTGFVLSEISRTHPEARLAGSEIYTAGLTFAAERMPGVELIQMDARNLPYEAEYDVIGAFDVLEHILEDELVLKNMYRAVKPGGGCLITVPQHQWLWSPVDEAACHQRRYTASELNSKAEAAGFRVLRSTSFVTLLLPLMFASRLKAKHTGQAQDTEALALNPLVDRTLEAVLRIEHVAIRAGINLPVGGSRLVILKRQEIK